MYLFDDETKDRIIEKLENGKFIVNISDEELTCGKITFSILIPQIGKSYVHHTIISPVIFYKHTEFIMNKPQGNKIQDDLNKSIVGAYNRGVVKQNKINQAKYRKLVDL